LKQAYDNWQDQPDWSEISPLENPFFGALRVDS
jgi:hypothetical protein